MNETSGLLLVMAGLSGSGKSYITQHLVNLFGFVHVPSITTRLPRPGEVNGVDRIFCTHEEFFHLRNSGRLICESYMFSNWYANDIHLLNQYREGKKVVCQLRYSALLEMKTLYPETKIIYIWPNTIEETIKRVKDRLLSEAETQRRIIEIQEEVAFINEDKSREEPIIDLHFINDYSNATVHRFMLAMEDLLNEKIK